MIFFLNDTKAPSKTFEWKFHVPILLLQRSMGNSSSDDDSDHGLTFNDKGSARLQGDDPVDIQGPAKDQWKLYISHFLSTWNSRVFEFGAVLFLAVGFPQTLIPASIYALFRSASVILFSSWLGHLVDHSNRLQLIKITIVGQRASVATSCVLLYLMTFSASGHRTPAWILLAVLSLLACVEKLCSVINTISVERDWVVVISGGSDQELQGEKSSCLKACIVLMTTSHELTNETYRSLLQACGAIGHRLGGWDFYEDRRCDYLGSDDYIFASRVSPHRQSLRWSQCSTFTAPTSPA